MKRLDSLHWSLIIALLSVLAFFLVSPYRYEHWMGGSIVRINRITGDAERLTINGWVEMRPGWGRRD